MPEIFYWTDMTARARAAADAAASSFHDLYVGADFNLWETTAIGVGAIRTEALRLCGLGPDDINQHRYKMAFRQLMMSGEAGDLAQLHADRKLRTTLKHLLWWAAHFESVRTWHNALDINKRMQWNHPTTVWRHHPEGGLRPEPEPLVVEDEKGRLVVVEEATPPGPAEREEREITRLREEHATIRAREEAQQRDPWGHIERLVATQFAVDPVNAHAIFDEMCHRILRRFPAPGVDWEAPEVAQENVLASD